LSNERWGSDKTGSGSSGSCASSRRRARPIERGLHGRNAAVDHIADLLQRVAEHVHEDDAATLRDWQPHEGAQTGDGDLTVVRGACGVNDHVGILVRAGCVPSGAVAQKVQCRIVGDTKQPALRVNDRSGIGQRFERLDDRFLHHVLSVDDRAGHARAVAMQLGPQFAEQPIARRARFN